jgi:hypothetical protein
LVKVIQDVAVYLKAVAIDRCATAACGPVYRTERSELFDDAALLFY